MIPLDRLTEFKRVLGTVDWNYHYAEGENFWRGEAGYKRAVTMKEDLVAEFPADAETVLALWKSGGKEVGDAPR